MLPVVPQWISRESFARLGIYILGSSHLLPSDYKIREIADKNTLKESLLQAEATGFNLFAREVRIGSISLDILYRVLRAGALAGIFTVGASVGIFWHATATCLYTISSLHNRDNLSLAKIHCISMLKDAFMASPTLVTLILGPAFLVPGLYGIVPNLIHQSCAIALMAVAGVELMNCFFEILFPGFSSNFCGWSGAIFLKRHFGVVAEKGWLLKDTDGRTDTYNAAEKRVEGLFIGYRSNLIEKCYNELVLSLKKMHLVLTQAEIQELSKSPAQLIELLKNFIDCSRLEEMLKIEADLTHYIENATSSDDTRITLDSFWSAELLANCLKDKDERSTIDENFSHRLLKFKEAPQPTDLSENLQTIWQRVMQAKEPYTVLDIKRSNDQTVSIKAFKRLSGLVHPSQRAEADPVKEILFSVIKAAKDVIETDFITEDSSEVHSIKMIEGPETELVG